MTNVKKTGGAGTTGGVTHNPDIGTIRPMYGAIMRTDLAQIASGVKNIKKDIEGALGRHELMGRDLKDANEALTQINKAVLELAHPGGKVARKSKDTPSSGRTPSHGGMVAMYGVIIRDSLNQFRTEIQSLLGRVNQGIATGQFASKTDLQDAKQTKRRLENALTMLNIPG